MLDDVDRRRSILALCSLGLLLLLLGVLVRVSDVSAQAGSAGASAPEDQCPPNGPEFDGMPLDKCHIEDFDIGGVEKSITVWYTEDQTPKDREVWTSVTQTEIISVTNWLSTTDQAEQVAQWGREAWEAYYDIFHRSPRDSDPGCDNNIDLWVYDTAGPSFAPWPHDIQDCRIVINAPMIRGGTGQEALHHEFFHYLQFSYNDGCYDHIYATYNHNAWTGSAEFTEGYADLAHDVVDAGLDAKYFDRLVWRHRYTRSLYIEGYWNLFTKYFAEQMGSEYTTADPEYHMDAVREHYEECDAQDTYYVLDTLVPRLSGGTRTMDGLVVDFYAANYAYPYVDLATDPELFYVDPNPPDYGNVIFEESEHLSDSRQWHGDFYLTKGELECPFDLMPQEYAAHYYRVYPEAGCDYVTAGVDGEAGARLGINVIVRENNPNNPDYFRRWSWIGEDYWRTIARRSNNFPIVVVVNSFNSTPEFDAIFTCVAPDVQILEPRQANFALVGDPASPDTFLLRFQALSDGSPVKGLRASQVDVTVGGLTADLVDMTFQEIGDEYWAIVRAPVAATGTTWADLAVTLEGGLSDSETHALLYIDPGHTDIGLLFDASGSMNTEDAAGEGRRYENAKKAGTVLADLLRDGDRVLVMDFSSTESPDPVYDIRTLLARTDVTVPDTIDDAKAAIDQILPRGRTPIGKALQEAKDNLLAAPDNNNPKFIVLLSDGEENTTPYYADIKQELLSSGVVVDTVAFSDEADVPLMAQIAADTGGSFRYVPTSPGAAATLDTWQLARLESLGLPPHIASRVATVLLPGPLGLDEAYDYFEAKNQDASRLFLENYTEVPAGEWVTAIQYVDTSATRLRLVVASKQSTQEANYFRDVEVLPPGADPITGWVQVSGLSPDPTPASWSVRVSDWDTVIVITDPTPGIWRLRACGYTITLAQNAPEAITSDFMLSGSIQSQIRLQGRFLSPIVDYQGKMGDHVPIVATLLNGSGGVVGATVVADLEKPDGSLTIPLYDDGNHSDSAADDGIYGTIFAQTGQGGTYNVRLVAAWQEGGTGDWLSREWTGAFWLEGLEGNDADGDNMPDPWEDQNGLDSSRNDANEDLDFDGLLNILELQAGTRPNQSDTDHGGENDHSELQRGRDPLYSEDDAVDKMGVITTIALNGTVILYWPYPDLYSSMQLYVSTDPDDEGTETNIGNTGVHTLTSLTNDVTYYLRLKPIGLDGISVGDLTAPMPVIPRADPDAPNGMLLINNGARSTGSKEVVLSIWASDVPLPGPAAGGGAVANRWTRTLNEVSGGIKMRISNDPWLGDASWEPYQHTRAWTLGESGSRTHEVFAQFRDAAGNVSFVVWDAIVVNPPVYLPLVLRSR